MSLIFLAIFVVHQTLIRRKVPQIDLAIEMTTVTADQMTGTDNNRDSDTPTVAITAISNRTTHEAAATTTSRGTTTIEETRGKGATEEAVRMHLPVLPRYSPRLQQGILAMSVAIGGRETLAVGAGVASRATATPRGGPEVGREATGTNASETAEPSGNLRAPNLWNTLTPKKWKKDR